MKRSPKITRILRNSTILTYICRYDNKSPFRFFFRQDKKYAAKIMSNAADNTATKDARILTTEEELSLS